MFFSHTNHRRSVGSSPFSVIRHGAESNFKHCRLGFQYKFDFFLFFCFFFFWGTWMEEVARLWLQFATADWETTRNCPLVLFDVLVGAKCWFKYNALVPQEKPPQGHSRCPKLNIGQSQYFTPQFNTTCRHFYCLVLQTALCRAPLICRTRDICRTKVSMGHSIFPHLRKYVKHTQSRDYG